MKLYNILKTEIIYKLKLTLNHQKNIKKFNVKLKLHNFEIIDYPSIRFYWNLVS